MDSRTRRRGRAATLAAAAFAAAALAAAAVPAAAQAGEFAGECTLHTYGAPGSSSYFGYGLCDGTVDGNAGVWDTEATLDTDGGAPLGSGTLEACLATEPGAYGSPIMCFETPLSYAGEGAPGADDGNGFADAVFRQDGTVPGLALGRIGFWDASNETQERWEATVSLRTVTPLSG